MVERGSAESARVTAEVAMVTVAKAMVVEAMELVREAATGTVAAGDRPDGATWGAAQRRRRTVPLAVP